MNLKKLIKKRIDLIFIDKHVAKHILKKNYPQYIEELEFMNPPLEYKKLYVAFSKKRKFYNKKLNAFNKGLSSMYKDGTVRKIIKKHGF